MYICRVVQTKLILTTSNVFIEFLLVYKRLRLVIISHIEGFSELFLHIKGLI